MLILPAIFACTSAPSSLPDADQDGFTADVDCDDSEADVFPGGREFCDGLDNDCDGEVDAGATDARTFYVDDDGDGFGAGAVEACERPEGTATVGGDCDDANAEVRPLRTELCGNGIDDDCDGLVDTEPSAAFYPDADGDGYGDEQAGVNTCTPPADWIAQGGDCDDVDPDVNPGADEICDSIDNDCDERIDDEDPTVTDLPVWYPDADGDGFGTSAFSVEVCVPPAGIWALTDDDCDDFVASIAPGAPEICNGVDDDCDGVTDTQDAPAIAGPRTPWTLGSTVDTAGAVGMAVLDLQALWEDAGGTGPVSADVRAVIGSCATGWADEPVRFLDDRVGPTAPDTDGDGTGLLVIAHDPDGDPSTSDVLAAGAPVTGWLHFAATSTAGGASATQTTLSTGVIEADFDGTLALSSLDVAPGSSQSSFRPRLQTPAGSLFLAPGSVTADDHPAVSRIAASGGGDNGVAGVSWSAEWLVISGRPELWGRVQITTAADTELVDATDWRNAVTGFSLGLAGVPTDLGGDWYYGAGSEGVVVRVISAPGAAVQADPGWLDVVGTDAPGPVAAEHIVATDVGLSDVEVLIVGAPDDEAPDRLAEIDAPVTLDVGPQGP